MFSITFVNVFVRRELGLVNENAREKIWELKSDPKVRFALGCINVDLGRKKPNKPFFLKPLIGCYLYLFWLLLFESLGEVEDLSSTSIYHPEKSHIVIL